MSETTPLRLVAYAATDVGRVREGNEDSLFRGTTVFAVADGMGGHQAGEVASETALRPIAALDGRQFADEAEAIDALVEAIRAANRTVVAKADSDPRLSGMGTTLTAATVLGSRLVVAHVGDSRAYLLSGDEPMSQLTTDHTLVEQLVQEGRLSRDEIGTHPQRSVITRAIGVDEDVEVDTFVTEVRPGDQVLLCSDGLSGVVKDDQIADILDEHADGDEACRALIAAANEAGGPDNITVVLLRVVGEDTPVADPADQTVDLRARRPMGEVRKIRTRVETGEDWARSMSRYGAPQGVETRPAIEPGGGVRRVLAGILAALVLLALIVGGGYFLLARSYFVGVQDGVVTIFNGLPQEVAGLPLHWERSRTDLAVTDLPPLRQERLAEGITVGTLSEADRLVDTLRDEAEQLAEEQAPPQDTATEPPAADAPTPSGGAGT
ncbi:MAG TPA: Stp1/IreP family PP2C-type Ser/Thr phosphatase [Egibacteraceae bacterium]